VNTWDLLADLPLEIEGCTLEGLSAKVSSDFERLSTVIHLQGSGEEGLGEDVTYDAPDHEILQEAGPPEESPGRAQGQLDDGELLRGDGEAEPRPRASAARGVAALPGMGV
jgi:hypothetical protein